MLNASYKIIFLALLSMIASSVLLYFDVARVLAYVLLVVGFFGIGIGILIGFFKMVTETDNESSK